MSPFLSVRWESFYLSDNRSAAQRIDDLNEDLAIQGFRVKDRAAAITELLRPDGIIEIVQDAR